MALNTNIALSGRQLQLDNPLEIHSRFMQAQAAQNQNSLAQMQIRETQRKMKEEESLNALYQGIPLDASTGIPERNALLKKLAEGGMGSRIPGVVKQFGEAEAAGTKQQLDKTKLISERLDMSRKLLEDIDPRAPQAAEQYIQWHQANHSDPILGPVLASRGVTAESANQQIQQALQQPGGLTALIERSKLGAAKFAEIYKPIVTAQSTGDTNRQLTYDPLTRTSSVVPGSAVPIAMSAAETEANKIARQRVGIEQQRVGLEGQRVGIAQEQLGLSRTEAERKAANNGVDLTPKDRQKREASYPRVTSALKGFEAKADGFIADLEKLRKHPGLSEITGLVAGRVPGLTANGRAAEALYNKVVAKGGFSALQEMRDASPTGGALGNVSNQEGKQLTASFAAIDRKQDAKDVQAAIDQAVADIRGAKTRTREAYDMTYEYRAGRGPVSVPVEAPPADPAGLSPAEQAELKALRERFKK